MIHDLTLLAYSLATVAFALWFVAVWAQIFHDAFTNHDAPAVATGVATITRINAARARRGDFAFDTRHARPLAAAA